MASDHKPGPPCLPPSGQNGIYRKNDTQLCPGAGLAGKPIAGTRAKDALGEEAWKPYVPKK